MTSKCLADSRLLSSPNDLSHDPLMTCHVTDMGCHMILYLYYPLHPFSLTNPPRFFCDCGAGALGRDCLLTGYKAFSSAKGSRSHHTHSAAPAQSNVAVQQNVATS